MNYGTDSPWELLTSFLDNTVSSLHKSHLKLFLPPTPMRGDEEEKKKDTCQNLGKRGHIKKYCPCYDENTDTKEGKHHWSEPRCAGGSPKQGITV